MNGARDQSSGIVGCNRAAQLYIVIVLLELRAEFWSNFWARLNVRACVFLSSDTCLLVSFIYLWQWQGLVLGQYVGLKKGISYISWLIISSFLVDEFKHVIFQSYPKSFYYMPNNNSYNHNNYRGNNLSLFFITIIYLSLYTSSIQFYKIILFVSKYKTTLKFFLKLRSKLLDN